MSYQLVTQMQKRTDASVIAWGRSQKLLPFFFPYALGKSIYFGRRGVDLVHIGDPVMAPIGWVMKKLFQVPVVVTVHGLDITFPVRPYQWLIPRLLQSFDRIVCISSSTRDACTERRISAQKCEIVRPGVTVPPALFPRDAARQWLEWELEQDLRDVGVLLTVGRLVPRKGVAWFVESVLPPVLAAGARVCYVVVGSGPDQRHVHRLASHLGLDGKVYMLGQVSEDELARIYAAADLFIMPNLSVPGDMEGFGQVALEAAAHALPVLAADLEGIRDAVIPGRTGRLAQSANADVWGAGVLELLNCPVTLREMGKQAHITAQECFTWAHMADAYEVLFREVLREYRQ